MTNPLIEQVRNILCPRCGDQAVCAIVMDNLPYSNYTPACERCLREHEETERDIQDHEMRHFGGYYGIPTSHTVPLSEMPSEVEFEIVEEPHLLTA